MPTDQLTLHSQAVRVDFGDENYETSGTLMSGDAAVIMSAVASAIRFQLPAEFSGSATIHGATLNLYARDDPSGGYDHVSRIRVLASSDQSLPTTSAGVLSASGGSEQKTIGVSGTETLDHTLTTTAGWYAIDVTAMLNQAAAAGRLDGDYVVLLIQPLSYDEGTNSRLNADGLTQTNAPTLDLDWSHASPPPPDEVVQPADAQVRVHATEPQVLVNLAVQPADAQIRVHATEPQVAIVGHPADAQVRVRATEPQVLAHWTVQPADAQVAIEADEPQPTFDWVAQPANAQVLTQATLPRVYGPQRSRGLFPSDLFPSELL